MTNSLVYFNHYPDLEGGGREEGLLCSYQSYV